MRRGRGFSLAEVLVATAVVLAISGTTLTFLNAAFKSWALSQEQGEDQMTSLLAIHTLQTNMQHSDVHSVYVNPHGATTAISFLSGLDDNNNIQYVVIDPKDPKADYSKDCLVLWQRHLVYYVDDASHTLRLANVPLTPTTDPQPYRLDTFSPGIHDRVVAFNVLSLTFTAFDDTGAMSATPTVNPLLVQISVLKKDSKYPPTTLQTTVLMDNGFFTGGGVTLVPSIFNVKRH